MLSQQQSVITEDVSRDKLIADIDQQIQILSVIAQDNPILTEQLRLLHEAREAVLNQQPKKARLADWSHFSRFKLSEPYFDVDDLDSLWAALEQDGLRPGVIKKKDYGTRQFAMLDLDGYEIAITGN